MIALQVLIASATGLFVAFGVLSLVTMIPNTQSRTRSRIATIAGQASEPYRRHVPVLQDERVSSIRFIDSFLTGRAWTERTGRKLEASGIPLRVGEYGAIRVLAIIAGVLVGRMSASAMSEEATLGIALAIAGGVVGLVAPPWYVNVRVARRHAAIEEQLVELCEVVASMLQTGYGYMQAMAGACTELEPPISNEIQRMLDKVRLGGDIDEALQETNDRLQSADFDMIATAISLQRTSGGNLAEILRSVAETIRDRRAFAREVSALTSKERYSAVIVAGFPLVLVGALCLVNPEVYTRLFTDLFGRVILGLALTLDVTGYFVINRLTKLEV